MDLAVKKLAAAWLFFAGLAAGLLWHPLINRLSLVPWQLSYLIDSVYRPGADAVLDKYPNNPLLFDVAFQFFPWSAYTLERIRHWDIPLWNPYSLAGLPFLANHQSSVFELTKLLGYGLKLDAIWLPTFSWLLTIALAGFFTFVFLREIGLSFEAALVGGTAFALSGPMVVWLGWPHSSTALWLPFLLFCAEKIIKNDGLKWVSFLAAGIAFVFFAGHIQIAWFVAFTCLAWTIFRAATLPVRNFRRLSLKLALAGILGLGLASIQLWPTLEFIQSSSIAGVGRGPTKGMDLISALRTGKLLNPHGYLGAAQSLLNVGLFVYPPLLGDSRTEYSRPPGNANEAAVYIGVIALGLALTGLLFGRRPRSRAFFWAVLAVAFIGAAWSVPGPAFINYLPFFKMANTGRLRFIVAFALSVLAAIGVDGIFANDNGRRRTASNMFLGLTIALSASAFAFVGLSSLLGNKLPTGNMLREEASIAAALILSVIVILRLALSDVRKKQVVARGLLVAVVAGELLLYGVAYREGIDSRLVAQPRRPLVWLQESAGIDRVTSFKRTPENRTSLFPNSSVIFGLQDIRGYEVINVGRFERLQGLVAGTDSRIAYKDFNRKFFNLTGVRYFIQSRKDPDRKLLESEGLIPAYKDGNTVIYRNDQALPRAFVVYQTENATGAGKALSRFEKGRINFRRRAIVENGPAIRSDGDLTPAEIIDYHPESITIEVVAAQKGLLVLTDTYFPGWQAFVDGKRTKIYPANVAFRGVLLAKGRHRVKFVYRPDSYRRSLYIFWPSLLIVFGLAGADIVRRRRARVFMTREKS